MKRFRLFLVSISAVMVLMMASAHAQFTQDPFDLGAADTVTMVMAVTPVAATNQLKVQMELWVFNDGNNIIGATTGFKWTNTNLNMDSARTSPLTTSAFNLIRSVYEGQNINTTNLNDRFLFGGARSDGSGVVAGPSRRLWATYYFTLTSWSALDSIVLDTLQYNGGTVYKYVDEQNHQYKPYWTGRIVVHDPAYVPPAHILLSKDTLYFSSIVGQPSPPGQQVVISSDGNNFAFSLIESTSWLLKSPNSGTTPVTAMISVNTTALPAAVYFDSIEVNAPGQLNSPQYIYVQLDLQPPLPKIKTAPTAMFFNAVAGGSNPASQNLKITNIGGGTMNWTVAASQPWLGLAPASGVDSGTVVVSCDITGLPTGTFYDTIVVSDPTAVNNPVRVPVQLSLGSNLPMIIAENQINHWVLDFDTVGVIFTRTFKVKNGGIGTLDYTVTENSARIQHITPVSGTAPQTLSVEYKITSAYDGADFWDTVMITSPQAVNSPYPVILHLHYVSEPAVIGVPSDTVTLNLFECQEGEGKSPQVVNIPVLNAGGDDPVNIAVASDTTYYNWELLGSELPTLIRLTPKQLGLPIGTYLDSMFLSYDLALNSPRKVIIKYKVNPAAQTPELTINREYLTIPYQEESGPSATAGFDLNNKYGGCLSWYIEEDIPFMFPSSDSGTVPANWGFITNAPGYVLGQYYDTMYVHAPGAVNPDDTIPVALLVWRFHGDWNYDGQIDIVDLTDNLAYLFNLAPIVPLPTFLVGDCDCDNNIDVADVTWIIAYLFLDGPIPCGNPY